MKKMTLAEAAKQMLERKKQQQNERSKPSAKVPGNGQAVHSQITKKPNNQKRRTGV